MSGRRFTLDLRSTVLGVAALGLIACGGSSGVGAGAVDTTAAEGLEQGGPLAEPIGAVLSELARCEPSGPIEGSSLSALFDAPLWIEYSNEAVKAALADSQTTEFGSIAIPTVGTVAHGAGSVPDTVYVHRRVVEGLTAMADGGASFMFPVFPGLMSPRGFSTQLAFNSDEFTFVDGCRAQDLGGFVNEFASNIEPGLAVPDLVRQLITPHSEVRLKLEEFESQGKPSTPWQDLPAEDRLLDPESAPPAIIDELDTVPIVVDIPAEWSEVSGTICFYLPTQGWWWGCLPTSLDGDRTIVQVEPYVRVPQGLQVWLTDNRTAADARIALLGTVSPSVISAALEQDGAIILTFGPPNNSASLANAFTAVAVSTATAAELFPETTPGPVEGP